MADPQLLKIAGPWKGKFTKLPLSEQPPGTVIASRDILGTDCKTGRACLSVRPGYAAFGSLSSVAGFATLGVAYNEAGAVQLMAATSGNLYRWTGSAWSNVGSITSSTSRTVHMASYGQWMFVASNAPYRYYDYDANNDGTPDHTMADWTATTAGTIPPNCRLICEWNGRMVLAASVTVGSDPGEPHVINFSRSDDPFDWDTTAEDSGAAVSIPIHEAATCLIPHNRNCLIVGTKSSMWIFRGNPAAANAILEKFSFVTGPVNSSAWCKTADDNTYFLAHDGLYRMAPGCGAPPEDVSRNIIPDGLLGIDGTNTTAYLVYDERFRGVQIHCQGTNIQSWFYDVDSGAIWSITPPGTTILSAHRFGLADSVTASGSLVATSSGVYRFDSATALGGSDNAYVTLLYPLAPIGYKGIVTRGVLHFGSNTDDTTGTIALYGGATATKAVALTADRKDDVTLSMLLANNGTWFPRVGGQSLVVKYTQGNVAKHMSLEGGTLSTLPNGIERG